MTHLGDLAPGDEIHFLFTTVTTTGAPTQLAGSPAAAVYREGNTTESTAGLTLLVDHDSRTGMNYLKILTAADASFYYDRAMYNVVLTAGTVGGTSAVGYKICSFRMRQSIAEQVWGQSVGAIGGVSDSFASAIAEIWNRIGSLLDAPISTRSSSTQELATQALVANVQDRLPAGLIQGRMDSHVGSLADGVVTEQKFSESYWVALAARIWTASVGTLGGVSDSFAGAVAEIWTRVIQYLDIPVSTRTAATQEIATQAQLTDVQSRLPAGLIGGRMDSHVGSVADGAITEQKFSESYWTAMVARIWGASVGALGGVSDSFAHAVTEIWSKVGAYLDVAVSTRASSSGSAPSAAEIADAVWDEAVSGHLGAGTFGAAIESISARLPASLVGGRIDAHIGSAADGVLTFTKFSQGFWDGVQVYVWTASVGQYSAISDSFAGTIADIRNRTQEIPGEVWDIQLTAHLQAGSTGFALNAAGAAGDPWSTALPGAYGAGSAGFIVGTNLDTTVSSRASTTLVNTVGTIVTDISARLPAGLIGGRIDAHVGSLADGVLTIAKFAQSYWDAFSTYVWGQSVGALSGVSDSFGHALAEVWARVLALLDVAVSTRAAPSDLSALATATQVSDLSGRLPTALINGRMAVHVEAISDGVISFTKFSQGYWDGVQAYVWSASVGQYGSVSDSFAGAVAEMWTRSTFLDVPVSTRLAAASYTAPSTPPTALEIADAVWDEALSGHLSAGSTGEALSNAGGGASPDAIAQAVWGYSVGGFVTVSDSFGALLHEVRVQLDAPISSRLAASDYTAPPSAAANADALLGRNIAGGTDGGRTVTQALYFLRNRWVVSAGTLTVYGTDDSTPSWTGSVQTDAAAVPVVGNDPA